MKKLHVLAAVVVAVIMITACDRNNGNYRPQFPPTADVIRNAVKDYDGNKYDAVRIGDQVWMASNLKTTHYADGREIPQGDMLSLTSAYRYFPDNNSQMVDKYGYLYNWPAVMRGEISSDFHLNEVQGICPTGWHVPCKEEWERLKNAVAPRVQYEESVAQAFASNDTSWRISYESGAPGQNPSLNNSTGFSALPAGRYNGPDYCNFGNIAYFWSSSQINNYPDCEFAYLFYLFYDYSGMDISSNGKNSGCSVRCVKD